MHVQSINLVSVCMNHLVRRKLPLAVTGSIKIAVLDTGIQLDKAQDGHTENGG